MSKTKDDENLATQSNASGEFIDGRKARSERSRQGIIDALFSLVQSGEVNPSAARVAETADVSLRTVFRHFEEMDGLYREMARQSDARYLPVFKRPYSAADWKGQVRELLDRRMTVFEEVMYLRICTAARRYQSEVLMEDYRRFSRMERESIEALVPEALKGDDGLVAALDVAMGLDAYRRLRQERGLSAENSRSAITRMVDAILFQVDV